MSEAGQQIGGLKKIKFFEDHIEYKNRKINFEQIKSVKFTSEATKHSIYFIPTGTTYESDLYLILKDDKRIQIKQESSFFKGISQKDHSEAIWKASEIISIATFNSRVDRYEKEIDKKGFIKVDAFQISNNGDLFKKRKLLFNINSNDIATSLGPFQINFSRSRKGLGRLLGDEEYLIPIDVDRDCILYILKHRLRFGLGNTHVREKLVDYRKLFFIGLLKLSAKLAKVDGKVSPEEIEVFKKYFDVESVGIGDASNIFNTAVNSKESVSDIAKSIFSSVGDKKELLEYVIIGLLQIAKADGVFHPKEIVLIDNVANIFGLTSAEKWSIFSIFGIEQESELGDEDETDDSFDYEASTQEKAYLRVLNLKPGATREEIKFSYRCLAKKHHPDVLQSQGVPISEIRQSENILKSINEAYDYLTR